MASKIERLRARLKGMRESTERIGRNVLHSGETLLIGGGGAYAEGRLSDDNGEWGYKGVPFLYMGGAIAYLTGLFAGDRYSADLFAAGTGAVGGHLFRSMYETGLDAKQNRTTGGRVAGRRKVPMGLQSRMNQATQQSQQAQPAKKFGTVFDNVEK